MSYTTWKRSVFGVFLVRILPHLDSIRRDTPYSVQMRGNTDQKNSRIRTLLTQCKLGFFVSVTYWESAYVSICRGSRPEVFCKKDVLRNFAKFTGKHLCQSVFFNKVAGWPATKDFSCTKCAMFFVLPWVTVNITSLLKVFFLELKIEYLIIRTLREQTHLLNRPYSQFPNCSKLRKIRMSLLHHSDQSSPFTAFQEC